MLRLQPTEPAFVTRSEYVYGNLVFILKAYLDFPFLAIF